MHNQTNKNRRTLLKPIASIGIVLLTIIIFAAPSLSQAKSGHPRGYERAKGSSITVSEPLGWPVSVSSSVKAETILRSFPKMATIRMKPYRAWYSFSLPATTTISISGLPKNKDLHLYQDGFNNHSVVRTSSSGKITVEYKTADGLRLRIQEVPSTYHIAIDPLFAPPGGDCNDIGTWDAPTKTCTLIRNVTQTISIDDPNITLNGGGLSVVGIGTNTGIYTDQDNVVIKNIHISGWDVGIEFESGLIFLTSGGQLSNGVFLGSNAVDLSIIAMDNVTVDSTTIAGSLSLENGIIASASSNNLTISNTTLHHLTGAIYLDSLEGGNVIRNSTLRDNLVALGGSTINSGSLMAYHNNFYNNNNDITSFTGNILLSTSANRGNYWKKNTSCARSGNTCTNSYTIPATSLTDQRPWACANAWQVGVTCPTIPPTGGGASAATLVIKNTVDGGHCRLVGTWNFANHTCTMTTNGTTTIELLNEDPTTTLTLDGNNKFLEPIPTGVSLLDGINISSNKVAIKNLKISRFSKGLNLSGATDISIEKSTIQDSITAISAANVTALSIHESTLSGNTTAFALDNVSGSVYRNNFLHNATIEDPYDRDLSFTHSTNRGNYYDSNTDCVRSTNSIECTNDFMVVDVTWPLTNIYDTEPWACQDAWTRTSCPKWGSVIVSGTSTTASIYSDPNTSNPALLKKIVPPGWVFEIMGPVNGVSLPVHDYSDGLDGYISSSNIDQDPSQQSEFASRATPSLDSTEARKQIIVEAIENYIRPSSITDIYHQGGGLDGNNNFAEYINDLNFPTELFLAMAKHESAQTFDNTICNRPYYSKKYERNIRDGGIGIFQMTSADLKGKGSGMRNIAHKDDCDTRQFLWPMSDAYSNYYSNTTQGIYANIKDALRALQEKYEFAVDLLTGKGPRIWFSDGNIVVNNSEMKLLLTIRGYNGFGKEATECYKFLHPNGYLNALGTEMRNIGDAFPSYSYPDSGKVDDMLITVDKPENRAVISICSPGLLQIEDSSGNITGYTTSGVVNEISNVLFDESTNKNADILFPQEDYIIRVIGTESGTYNLYEVRGANDGTLLEFHAQDIPLGLNDIHEYHIHFDTVNKTISSTLKVDKRGTGHFENTITGNELLTWNGLGGGETKVTICHRPPGNPSNAHTISVGEPAVRAHMAHGDTMGACSATTATTTSAIKVPPGQSKKELNTAGGGFVPPGQAKKLRK